MQEHSLVWFRGKDLRLSDHAPLLSAVKRARVTLLFVVDPYFFAPKRAAQRPHRMQFLIDSLAALERDIANRGGELLFVAGRSVDVVPRVASKIGATRVCAHRWTEPFGRERDARISRSLSVPFDLFEGETLLPPESVRTGAGEPFSVFTPFSRAAKKLLSASLAQPRSAPKMFSPSPDAKKALADERVLRPELAHLGLDRNPALLPGGEHAALTRLHDFLTRSCSNYHAGRDHLGETGTSRLSQDLKFGTISVRTVYFRAHKLPPSLGRDSFLNELLWREFAYATLWDRPRVLAQPFRESFSGFPYEDDEEMYRAWETGTTGIPIVDASARQLLSEGFVHNRARMISASFLTKNLLVPYHRGEAHYLRYLTDGDYAQNNMGWQWSAGSGVDAAPYFRVFNPVTQGQKFDPDGAYVKKYIPELSKLPARHVHAPWDAAPSVLHEAGVELGRGYPFPIVDLKESRQRFLDVAQTYLSRVI